MAEAVAGGRGGGAGSQVRFVSSPSLFEFLSNLIFFLNRLLMVIVLQPHDGVFSCWSLRSPAEGLPLSSPSSGKVR